MDPEEIYKQAVEDLASEFHRLEKSLDIVKKFTDKHGNNYKLVSAKGRSCHKPIYITYATYLDNSQWKTEVTFKMVFDFVLTASGVFEKMFSIDYEDYIDYE